MPDLPDLPDLPAPEPQPRLIVFLHGAGTSPQTWQDQVVAMPSQFRAVAPWLYGLRPGRKDVFDWQAAADDVARTLDLQGAETASICGVSLGARVALQFAVSHNDRLDRLVLASPPAPVPWQLRTPRNIVAKLVPRASYAAQNIDKDKVVAALKVASAATDLSGVDQITQPTLLLCGSSDGASIATARRIEGKLPSATVQVLPQAGHDVNTDAPDAFNQALFSFLD
ncbi:alpha/beta fold hydrolase [Microlunatus sp. Y2014]|uniref:alpha/beta fold hydrolase n=1 Tax=Microlunatus sp. Y2014 TaxID=3418488 RepID=UPI003DA71FB4